MPWIPRTLQQIFARLVGDANAEIPGVDAALPYNNLNPTLKVVAGGLSDLHDYADWIQRQRFVATADADQLDRHGAEMKPPVPRKLASSARGEVSITIPAGGAVPTGLQLARSDGALYSIEAGGFCSPATPAIFTAVALVAGAAGNAAAATVLTAASLSGATIVVAAGGIGGGADIESDAAYRRRLLFAKAYPEHAGALPDYVRYAMSVPGVTRVYLQTGLYGRSTIQVYPLFDDTRPDGIPTAADIAAVAAVLAERRPGAALPRAIAPSPLPINVQIGALSPNLPEVRQAIEIEIRAMLTLRGRVAGLMNPLASLPFLATPFSVPPSWIGEAASIAAGEGSHVLVSPTLPVAVPAGSMPVLGTLSFV